MKSKSLKSNLSRCAQSSLELRPQATATLAEVLRPNGPDQGPAPRHVLPAKFERGSAAESALDAAACYVRAAAVEGSYHVPYDDEHPEIFWCTIADSCAAALEAVGAIADPVEASIAEAIFQAAGWYSDKLRALTLRAQVEVQAFVMQVASKLKFLFAKQQAMDFGSVAVEGGAA